MRCNNWWMLLLAAAATLSSVNASLGDDNGSPIKPKSKSNQSSTASSDDSRQQSDRSEKSQNDKQGQNDTDRVIASWLGCLDAGEIELAQFAAGKADVNAVNKFLRRQVDEHQSMLGQMRKFAPDAGSDIGQSDGSSNANSDAAKSAQFNWHDVTREVANENLRTAKNKLRNQSGLDFDWAVVGQQKMIHDKMASDMTVLRKYASPKLREVIDDELDDVKCCQRTLDEMMDRLKNEEYQRYRNGNDRGSKAAGAASEGNSSTSTRDPSGRGSTFDNGYMEEFSYSETAFSTSVSVEHGSSGRARLGVTFDTDRTDECEIANVRSGGPADRAGIEAGDVILAVNGHEIDSVADFTGAREGR